MHVKLRSNANQEKVCEQESNLPSRWGGSSPFRPNLDTLKAADRRSRGRYVSRSLANTKHTF